jgi:hypothetical protein
MQRLRLKKGEKRIINWDKLVCDLIENCELYHQYYYLKNNFTGPSHHFHIRALNASDIEKTEMTYAVLVSWGMHRMGGGAQMNDYNIFQDSILAVLNLIQAFRQKKIETITEIEFAQLEIIFNKLNPMRTKKKIVAVSKVLAHYLPEIIAPIDNEYTFKFICQEASPPRNWGEFDLFKEIHMKLFKKVITESKFILNSKPWLNNHEFPWDTSLPKIVDNLIIGKIGNLKQIERNNKNPA